MVDNSSNVTSQLLPAVVMIHEWWGLNENIKDMANKLAEQGYVVLAADMYNGQVATTPDQAMQLAGSVRENPSEAIANLQAAVRYLGSLEGVNSSRIASLGWCFGGGQSLQLALNSEENPLAATVLYYGNLVLDEQELSKIQWPVLGIFGDQDESIPVENVTKFEQALNSTGVPNEIYIYEGVGHAFANPSGDNYAPEETNDAWENTLAFLKKHV
jgi:carboxymethylenebutenolidase